MKKSVIILALLAMQQLAIAQTVNVHFKNGQVVEYPSDNVDYVDFSAEPASPTVTAGQVVDLGLSVYWASCNLGADKPEEYGDYYAWGETKPKSSYKTNNYTYYNNTTSQYLDIGGNICGTQYDAATVNLGSDWRMPTKEEVEELINLCTWEWIRINEVNGYKVIGKNGNSIFLPASGSFINTVSGLNKKIFCYTGTEGSNIEEAVILFVYSADDRVKTSSQSKFQGLSIRPVTSSLNAGGNPIDHSQDHLVTDKISASYTGGSMHSVNGVIQSGSVLNFRISNGSTESIELIGIQLINDNTGSEGNNALSDNETISAGESKNYSITVGFGGILKPKARFTYKYNQKKYYVEASVSE